MADLLLSQITDGGDIQEVDEVYVNRSGADERVKLSNLLKHRALAAAIVLKANGKPYYADVSLAGLTVYTPVAPAIGDTIRVKVIAGNAATNKLIIDGNGETFFTSVGGGFATVTIDVPCGALELVFNGDEWSVSPLAG